MKYQFATVPAGATVQVYFYGNWGTDFRAFIDRIGYGPKCMPWEDLWFYWYIDGELIERYNYQIAEVKKPHWLVEPYIARNEILWQVVNNSAVQHICEVLCDGVLVMKPEAKVRYGV